MKIKKGAYKIIYKAGTKYSLNPGITPWYPQPSCSEVMGFLTILSKKLISTSFHTVMTMLVIFKKSHVYLHQAHDKQSELSERRTDRSSLGAARGVGAAATKESYLHQVLVDPLGESLLLNTVPFICKANTEKALA